MKPRSVAIVGAAETTELGRIPDLSQLQLHADAALNTLADAGLKPSDIDGVATAGESPTNIAFYLGITPTWVDSTSVGGCSFMLHVRHAAAATSFSHSKCARSSQRHNQPESAVCCWDLVQPGSPYLGHVQRGADHASLRCSEQREYRPS